MTSLDQLVIEYIETSSSTHISKKEKSRIKKIISANNFDEDRARMFGEFYANVNYKYELPDKIANLFITTLYNQQILKRIKFDFDILKRIISSFELIPQFYSTQIKTKELNTENVKKLNNETKRYVEQIKSFLIKSKRNLCDIELLEHLVTIDYNALFPGYLGKRNANFISFANKLHIILQDNKYPIDNFVIKKINLLLKRLSEYKSLDNKVTQYNRQFGNILYRAILYSEFDNVDAIINFLSSHNPEKDSLSSIFISMLEYIEKELFLISKDIQIEGYDVLNLIGEGAYKKTYRARDIILDCQVAAKVINIPTLAQQQNIQRAIQVKLGKNFDGDIEKALIKIFQDESKLMHKATRARSQNIAQIDRANYDEKTKNYIIIEELGNNTLADILAKERKLMPVFTFNIVKQILCGVKELHSLGFIHGDLKPENILINKDGSVRITDFGWSSQIPLFSRHHTNPKYLTNLLTCAPEVFNGKHPDKKSDIWSIGVITYRMLIGEWPFHHGFTGNEEEWKALPLIKKQEYAKKIREQMNDKQLSKICTQLYAIKDNFYITNYFENFEKSTSEGNRLGWLLDFIDVALYIEPESRDLSYTKNSII